MWKRVMYWRKKGTIFVAFVLIGLSYREKTGGLCLRLSLFCLFSHLKFIKTIIFVCL